MKHPHIEQLLLVELIQRVNAFPSRETDPSKHHLQFENITMINRVQPINLVQLKLVICSILKVSWVHLEVFSLNCLLSLGELRLQHFLHQKLWLFLHFLVFYEKSLGCGT